jgi:hypothetical protein
MSGKRQITAFRLKENSITGKGDCNCAPVVTLAAHRWLSSGHLVWFLWLFSRRYPKTPNQSLSFSFRPGPPKPLGRRRIPRACPHGSMSVLDTTSTATIATTEPLPLQIKRARAEIDNAMVPVENFGA